MDFGKDPRTTKSKTEKQMIYEDMGPYPTIGHHTLSPDWKRADLLKPKGIPDEHILFRTITEEI